MIDDKRLVEIEKKVKAQYGHVGNRVLILELIEEVRRLRGPIKPMVGSSGSYLELEEAKRNLWAGLNATLATLVEASDVVVADPGHSIGFAAQIEMVKRKASATLEKYVNTQVV